MTDSPDTSGRRMDEPDLAQLREELAPDLLAYFLRRVVPRDEAADLLHETLLVMCRRQPPGDWQDARLWAFGIARNVLRTHRRTASRRSALVERLRQEAAVITPLPDGAVDVHAALAMLDPIDQEILRLVYWEGFTQVEVATLLTMPAATVRSRHLRARAALKAALEAAETGNVPTASATMKHGAARV